MQKETHMNGRKRMTASARVARAGASFFVAVAVSDVQCPLGGDDLMRSVIATQRMVSLPTNA